MESSIPKITTDEKQHPVRFQWLTTFNDLMTLLMVFFVLLYAMSAPDVRHLKNFQNALQSAMGVLDPGRHAPVGTPAENQEKSYQTAKSVSDDEEGDQWNKLNETQGLEAEYSKRGIQLTLNDNLLFGSGSAQLTAPGRALLDKVIRIIAPLNRHIRVEGHTDNVPISTKRYPSNWELSTARAVSVVKYMQGNGGIPPQNLSAAGYGASKPRVANDSARNHSKNRRVEIILQQQVLSNSNK